MGLGMGAELAVIHLPLVFTGMTALYFAYASAKVVATLSKASAPTTSNTSTNKMLPVFSAVDVNL